MSAKGPLHIDEKLNVDYCVPLWVRDEQIKLAIARRLPHIKEEYALREEPIALVCFGPSLQDTWEQIKDFKYVMSCSGAHKFLVDRGIIPTWHVEVDPRAHKVLLMGPPQPETEYLIASTCHPAVFDHLKESKVTLWHVFDGEQDAIRTLPHGQWALMGGCSVGLRTMTIARFFGFTNQHVFGMDGNARAEDSHASEHPHNPKQFREMEYPLGSGTQWLTTSSMLEAAKGTWHELNQMPEVRTTFYGHGLVQTMAKDYVPQPAPEKKRVISYRKPDVISASYRDLNKQLHHDNIAYGVGGGKHAKMVLEIAQKLGTSSILDYGCQPPDAQVLTPSGWCRIGDIAIGDEVIGSSGYPIRVIGTHSPGMQPVYRVTFNDGASLVVDGNHLWAVRTSNHQKRNQPYQVMRTEELSRMELQWKNDKWPYRPYKWRIPMVDPIEFGQERDLPITPYLLGVLLGDGCLCGSNVSFTTATSGLPEIISTLLPSGMELSRDSKKDNAASSYRIVSKNRTRPYRANPIKEAIRKLQLDGTRAWEKFVPHDYLLAPAKYRIELLQGLLDTDGDVTDRHASYTTTSERLCGHVVFLAQSLGCNAKVSARFTRYQGGTGRKAFTVHIKPRAGLILTRVKPWIPRKEYHANRIITSIERCGECEVVGIAVDAPDQLYVTEHCLVTHNCGKGYLAKEIPYPIWEYDPAIPGKDESPRPADLVVCTDVLEHIEPEHLLAVLADLKRVTKTVGYFTIHTGAAQKTLPDGRNTHLIQKHRQWWKNRLKLYFTISMLKEVGMELHVVVTPKVVKQTVAA